MLKRSKIDISSIRRPQKPEKRKNIIKREAVSHEALFAMRLAKLKPVVQVAKQIFTAPQKPRWMVQIGSFAMASLLLVGFLQSALYLSAASDAQGEILGAATSAYSELSSAGKNLSAENFASAQKLFQSAQANINLAQDKLNNFRALKWLAPQANSADHVLKGASYLAEAGEKMSAALDLFDELKVSSSGVETTNINQKIAENRKLLGESRELIVKAADEFDLASGLPQDYVQSLDEAKQQVRQLVSILEQLGHLEDLYLGLFNGHKTYLLIFQNTDEIRATGGFIGTYGVLETDQGKITKLKIESIYQLDGQIYEMVAAPGPFQPAIKRWGIRDANWFADFPTSAEKLLRFFELGSQTADGVISTTPALFEELLRLVGPIEMNQYGETLTPENFQEIVQYKTSVDYDRELNQPKKFLADFAPLLLDRLTQLSKDQWFELFQIFEDNLRNRSILLYSKDSSVQKQISDLGFSGQILNTDYDYLSIINSNLGGTKTDLEVDQSGKLNSRILSDGSIINTLSVTRKNSATETNKNFIRILTPAQSQFVSATGFDDHEHFDSLARGLRQDPDLALWDRGELRSNVFVQTESGKNEFSGWVETKPREEKTVTVTYILPFRLSTDTGYSLLVQKQSGSKPFNFEGVLSLGQFSTKWLGHGLSQTGGIVNFSSNSNTDDFWPLVISK